MRIVFATVLAAGLTLAGCSEKTADSAASAAHDAVSDTASNLDVASSAVSSAADNIGSHNDESSATSETSTSSNGTTTTTTTTKKSD